MPAYEKKLGWVPMVRNSFRIDLIEMELFCRNLVRHMSEHGHFYILRDNDSVCYFKVGSSRPIYSKNKCRLYVLCVDSVMLMRVSNVQFAKVQELGSCASVHGEHLATSPSSNAFRESRMTATIGMTQCCMRTNSVFSNLAVLDM